MIPVDIFLTSFPDELASLLVVLWWHYVSGLCSAHCQRVISTYDREVSHAADEVTGESVNGGANGTTVAV